MTVRIIEEKPDPSVVKKVVCKLCGVTLEYLPIDLLRRGYCVMGESAGGCEYIKCLKCNNDIVVREWD